MGKFLRHIWRSQRKRGAEIKRQRLVEFVESLDISPKTDGKGTENLVATREPRGDPESQDIRVPLEEILELVLCVGRVVISPRIAISE